MIDFAVYLRVALNLIVFRTISVAILVSTSFVTTKSLSTHRDRKLRSRMMSIIYICTILAGKTNPRDKDATEKSWRRCNGYGSDIANRYNGTRKVHTSLWLFFI